MRLFIMAADFRYFIRVAVLFILFLPVLVLVVGGCGSEVAGEGFLSNYSWLKSNGNGGAEYLNAYELGNYSRFVVASVDVGCLRAASKDGACELTDDDIREVAKYMRYSLVREISKNYEVVEEYGPGVAVVRVSVCDVGKMTAMQQSRGQFTALGLRQMKAGQANIEGEIIDSVSGVQLAALIRKYPVNGGVEAGLDGWAVAMRERIDQSSRMVAELERGDFIVAERQK